MSKRMCLVFVGFVLLVKFGVLCFRVFLLSLRFEHNEKFEYEYAALDPDLLHN